MLQTVLVSIGTSLVVSLITFILGLKSGKNQADRAFLQKLYKEIYRHFCEIDDSMKEGRPKEWSDYKKIQTMHSTKYYPLVKELERTGDILYLKGRIAKEALTLEKDCLHYSYDANETIARIHRCIIDNPQFFNGGITFNSYQQKDDDSKAKTQNLEASNTYRIVSYFLFLEPDKLKSTLLQWKNADKQYALEFTTRGNPPRNSFTIYPGDLNANVDEFVNQIVTLVKKSDSKYSEIHDTKESLEKRIDKLKKKLSKRVKNPSTFWETFIGAFIDIFQ